MADDPGLAPPPPVPEGQQKLAVLQRAGVPQDQIDAYQRDTNAVLGRAGVPQEKINDYWGVRDPDQSTPPPALHSNLIAAAAGGWNQFVAAGAAERARAVQAAVGAGEQLKAASGYDEHGQPIQGGVDPGEQAGHLIGAATGFAGAAWQWIASPVVGAINEGPGATLSRVPIPSVDVGFGKSDTHISPTALGDAVSQVAGLVSGGGEIAAVSQTARASAMEAVAKGVIHDPGDFPGSVVGDRNVTPDMRAAIPSANDYINAAVQLAPEAGGAEAGHRIVANMRRIWVQTGLDPADQLSLSRSDPSLRQELMAQDPQGEPVTPNLAQHAKPEPKPLLSADTTPPPPRQSGAGGASLMRPPTARAPGSGEAGASLMAPPGVIPERPAGPMFVPSVDNAVGLLTHLEGSGDQAISPKGAVGKFQIMPGTARQYDSSLMGLNDAAVRERLMDPDYNAGIGRKIISHLFDQYHGNMDAIAIAYNAGPGRANKYLAAGPGTRLEAMIDKTVRGGVRYETVAAAKDESFLPLETQHYLANGRRRAGGPLSAEEGTGGHLLDSGDRPDGAAVPSWDNEALDREGTAPAEGEGEKIGGGSLSSASAWEGADTADAQREVLSNIGEQPLREWTVGQTLDHTVDQIFALNPARRLDTELQSEGMLNRDQDFGMEDAMRQTVASAQRADLWINTGALDGPAEKNLIPDSPSLKDAAKALKEDGGDASGFLAHLMAQRTVEKEAQGIDTGVNPFASRALVNDAKESAKYARATKIWTDVFNSGLDYAVGSGFLSADRAAAMKGLNTSWISFRRLMGDDASFKTKSGYGFNLGNPLRRMEGSDRQIVNPFISSVDNLRMVISSADQNWARGHLVGPGGLAELNPEIALQLGLRKLNAGLPGDDAIDRILEPYDMTDAEKEAARAAFMPLMASRAEAAAGPNAFTYIRDGVPEVWHVDDPAFAGMLRAASTREQVALPAKIKLMTIAGKDITIPAAGPERVMQTIAAAQRTGITVSPSFLTKNILSHQVIQWINDPAHPFPFSAPIKGFMDVVNLTDAYKDAQAKGALVGGAVVQDRDHLAYNLAELFGKTGVESIDKNGNVLGTKIWNVVTSPFEGARWLQEKGDAMNRVGLYKQGLERGLDAQKSAMRARTAGIDYSEPLAMAGLQWWAKTTPFFKADLLYAKNAANAWQDHPAETLFRNLAHVALPTAMFWAINKYQDQFLPPDEKYENVERWRKDYGLVLPSVGGYRLTVRYPELNGAVFGGMVTRMLDTFAANDPAAMRDWYTAFLRQLPLSGPPAIQAPAENAANYQLMTGRPMISGALTGANTDMQYTENTSMIARRLSTLITPLTDNTPLKTQFSPIALDHMISGWTGGAGQALAGLLNLPLGGASAPVDLLDNPFTHSLVIRHPGMNAQAVSDFYDEKAKFDRAASDISAEKRDMRSGDMTDLAQAQREYAWKQADGQLNAAAHAIALQSQAVHALYHRTDMSDDEKRQHIESIYNQTIQAAKGYTKLMYDFEAHQGG